MLKRVGLLTRTRKKILKKVPQGARCVFFYPKSYLFCDLKPHANPTITPSVRKVCGVERKEKERKIITNIVDTSFRCNA